jgi:vacuolar-type H+-ATPase subunit E/Vma4
MSNPVADKIIADAEAEAVCIQAEADTTIAVIEAETAAQTRSLESKASKARQKAAAARQKVLTAKAEQAASLSRQAAKRAVIESVLQSAHGELVNEPFDAYVARYSALLRSSDITAADITSVLAPANRADETKAILAAAGIESAAETGDFAAGLIVVTTNGRYDLTAARLLRDNKPEIEVALQKTL